MRRERAWTVPVAIESTNDDADSVARTLSRRAVYVDGNRPRPWGGSR